MYKYYWLKCGINSVLIIMHYTQYSVKQSEILKVVILRDISKNQPRQVFLSLRTFTFGHSRTYRDRIQLLFKNRIAYKLRISLEMALIVYSQKSLETFCRLQ